MAYYSRHTGEEVDSLLDKVKEGDVVEVDTSLSSTSKNPVQNKVVTSALSNKQDKLISGTNIKTINSIPILGEGNIIISGGGTEGGVSYEEVEQMLAGKQNVIDDLDSIREGASKGATALQEEDLSSVAISGDYNDLANKPTIPSAITEETVSGWGFTKNEGTYIKPDGGIPSSDLSNDVQSSLNKADTALQSYTEQYKGTVTGVKMNGEVKGTSGEVDLGTVITEHQDISGKQDVLVSGENIKTINGVSILGEGDIPIEGGGESYDDTELRNLISEKQDALVSGQNIKTINGSSLLGSGNIVIASEGGVSYDDTELRNLISNKVDKVEGKALSTNDFTDADKTKLDSLENYDDTNVVSLIRDKQDKLISGTNVKTINGTSILGEGNIEIEAGVYDDTELRNMIAGKQDTIEDLSTIRDNASKGATALQSVPSEYINETELQQQLSTKADINGDYPDMSVGLAEDLGGRPFTNDAEFSFRATADKENSIKDGLASIKTLKGNSVVWNQLWDINGDNRTDNVADMTINEREVVLSIQSIGAYSRIRTARIIGVVGHKYYVTYQAKYNSKSDDSSLIAFVGMSMSYANQLPLTNSYQTYRGIWVGDYAGAMNVGVLGTRNDGDIVSFKDIKVIDLTQLFQAGNEPTTIEEFYARKPIVEDEYAYNEGEVIHMTAEGIKSVGDNAWDEEWEIGGIDYNSGVGVAVTSKCRNRGFVKVLPNEEYYLSVPSISVLSAVVVICYDENKQFIKHIGGGSANARFTIPANCHYIRFTWVGTTYNNDIMISLVHSGWKQDTDAKYQPYWEDRLIFDQRIKDAFPNGMQKWDMVYNKNGKGYIVKGTGVEDLGGLNWTISSETYPRFFAKMAGVALPPDVISLANLLCVKLDNKTATQTYYGEVGISLDNQGYLRVYDPDYTDAATFKAAMAGVPLYYELAEPTIIEYDEPFNLDYKVADFGTEQAIGNSPSAPISAEIEYDFGANDTIRTNKLAINELREKIKDVTIEDIDTIREGAAKGMTAIQEHQDISHLATKEELNTISSSVMNYVEVPISTPTVQLAAVNTCYWFNGMVMDGTPITISAFELPNTPEARYRFCFFGPSSLTLPSDVSWLNGEIPELDPSCSYELDVVATQIVTGGYVYKAVLAKFSTPS